MYTSIKYVDANLDAPDNAISDNESSSEMLTVPEAIHNQVAIELLVSGLLT